MAQRLISGTDKGEMRAQARKTQKAWFAKKGIEIAAWTDE